MGLLDNLFDKFCWTYVTQLSIEECIDSIICSPMTFGRDQFNLHRYECIQYGDYQLLVIFRGAQYGRYLRTEYLLTFCKNNAYSSITVKFQREKIGLFPCISTYHLDIFMEEKIHAHRIS